MSLCVTAGEESIEIRVTLNRTWDRDYDNTESAAYKSLSDEIIGKVGL